MNGAVLTLTFAENLDASSVPATSAFEVTVNDTATTVSRVRISGATVTLTLATAAEHDDVVVVSYEPPATGRLQNADAERVEPFTVTADDETPDRRGPQLLRARADGGAVLLDYDEALDEASVPAASAYAVAADGAAATVSSVAVAGSRVELALASRVEPGDEVTVSYDPPASNPVRDTAGNAAAAFGPVEAENATAEERIGNVRLVGGNRSEGRLEMYGWWRVYAADGSIDRTRHRQPPAWGTVCDDRFLEPDDERLGEHRGGGGVPHDGLQGRRVRRRRLRAPGDDAGGAAGRARRPALLRRPGGAGADGDRGQRPREPAGRLLARGRRLPQLHPRRGRRPALHGRPGRWQQPRERRRPAAGAGEDGPAAEQRQSSAATACGRTACGRPPRPRGARRPGRRRGCASWSP